MEKTTINLDISHSIITVMRSQRYDDWRIIGEGFEIHLNQRQIQKIYQQFLVEARKRRYS